VMRNLFVTIFAVPIVAACVSTAAGPDLAVITVIGTNDAHGELIGHDDRAGMTTFSGYVAALRKVRAHDGDVLLVSAGDMWQGTLESNLNEGAAVVEAYNAMGYAAAAVGNHDFDFGPVGPKATPEEEGDDPQGALKRNAAAAAFPLLAANVVDRSTGDAVAWQNVRPSTIVTRAGIRIGIIGVSTVELPLTTIAANVDNIAMAPLAEAIIAEAERLRSAGAVLVVVAAHAGSACDEFDDPLDLSSCDIDGEIMRVANAIPEGLVDLIVAGHRHRGIAHVVNGIGLYRAPSSNSITYKDFTGLLTTKLTTESAAHGGMYQRCRCRRRDSKSRPLRPRSMSINMVTKTGWNRVLGRPNPHPPHR